MKEKIVQQIWILEYGWNAFQALLPGASIVSEEAEESAGTSSKPSVAKDSKDKVYAHQMIRTDSRDQKLDKFLSK